MNGNAFDTFGLVLLLVLAVAMPLLGIWDFRRLLRWVEEGRKDARIRTYRWILGMEWGLTILFTGWWLGEGRGLEALGLVVAVEGWQWLAVGLGLAAMAFVIGQMVVILRKPDQLRSLKDQAGDLIFLGPRTAAEGRLFTLVSVTAGVCEEILYRGALLAILIQVTGTWPAVALSSLIFGLGHAYQGPIGIVKTAFVGLVMALLTVFSGSILVPIVLHAVIDLTSGRMLAAANRLDSGPADPAEPACCTTTA